jgi:hypothetical protein
VPVQAEPGNTLAVQPARQPGVVKLPFTRSRSGSRRTSVTDRSPALLAAWGGPVDDGSDQNLYWSPFVRAERNLTTILLTYHAAANEALVPRTCELAGIADPYAAARVVLVWETLAPVEDILPRAPRSRPWGAICGSPSPSTCASLVLEAARRDGDPVPFDQVVLQPTSLCNLNCLYCYVPFRNEDRRMSPAVTERLAESLWALPKHQNPIYILWHFGEPLAVGLQHMRAL